MYTDDEVIGHTKAWINKVVIGCNFCPFAGREVKRNSIHYQILRSDQRKQLLDTLTSELDRLDNDESIATTLIILPELYPVFMDYLDMIKRVDQFLKKKGKTGIYQAATFHPDYLFAGADKDDPANYTNRSVYPMIHLLRENSITNALANFQNPENIPQRNIEYARQKGLTFMKILWTACLSDEQ
ncbi:MAG: DUF1415 domain-containing protein [Chitinophagaceae bacterium]